MSPPSLVPIQSIPLVTFPVIVEADRHIAESLQQSTPERLLPLSLSHPFNLVFDEDILGIAFSLMDLPTLGRCSRVCRLWYHLAAVELWRNALGISMRPLLEFMDTYYLESFVNPTYKRRRVRLSSEPSTVCWFNFQERVGRHIRSLTFNTSSLAASKSCLDLLNRSAPHIELPGLTELRVVVDQTVIELELATKLMQPSVKHLHLEVWEPLPDVHRAHYVMQREAELDIRMFKFDEITPPAYPLTTFFSNIARYMSEITEMAFNMRDFDEMRRVWPDFLNLYAALPQLKTLELPLRALTPTAIYSLTAHPSLKYLGARDFREKRNIALSEPYEDLLVLEGSTMTLQPNTLTEWRGLTITATPTELHSCFPTVGPLNLTLLHVNLSATVTGFDGISALIGAFAEVCPALQDLKLCPIISQNPHEIIRPNRQMLEPLRQLRDLASLQISATGASQLTDRDFAHLVSSWPQLRRLVLDHSSITVSEPFENAGLSIGAVFRTLKAHCPHLNEFLSAKDDVVSPKPLALHRIPSSRQRESDSKLFDARMSIHLQSRP
ncbi:hypothetical protein EIP86_001687 [Pleurotus ostreatoroseus]|nr:hypothetical protein EIP86_001687 [Pleurotus ostreatoroseus]